METKYELKLQTGKIVEWYGTDELNAAQRYVDCHPDEAVVATRPIKHGIYVGMGLD